MYDFVLPISQKSIKWKPLDVGQQLALGAAYQGNQKIYLEAAMYADRIAQYGDKAIAPGVKACSFHEIQQWDEIDYSLFVEEVDKREAERFAAYKKKDPAPTAIMKMEAALSTANEAMIGAMRAITETAAAVKEASLAANAPLTAK